MRHTITYRDIEKNRFWKEIEFIFGWDNLLRRERYIFETLMNTRKVPDDVSKNELFELDLLGFIDLKHKMGDKT